MDLDVEIELHSQCNLGCPLCTRNKKFYIDSKEEYVGQLDFRNLIFFLDQIKPKEIKLVGAICEPTLYSDFIELLAYAKKKGITIWLSTNGSVKSEKFWKQVAENIPSGSTLNFDIDHTDPIKHALYRRGSDLDKILKNIKIVQSNLKVDVIINALRIDFDFNKYNYEEFLRVAKDVWGIGVYSIPCYDYNQNEFYEDISFWKHSKQIHYKRLNKLDASLFSKNPEIICEAIKTKTIYLNYLGLVIPCCYINDLVLKEPQKQKNNNHLNIKDRHLRDAYIREYDLITKNVNTPTKYTETCSKFCNKAKRKMYKVIDLDP